MNSQENPRSGNLSAPLWAIAAALWVLAIVGIAGAMKLVQIQEGIQHQLDKIPKIRL